MAELNAKRLTTNFSKNLKDFNEILGDIGKKEEISKKDLQALVAAQKNITTATRAYLNDLNVDADIIRLIAPMMDGKFSNVDAPDFMNTIEQFEKDLKRITNKVKNELNNCSEKEALEMFSGLKDGKDIKPLESKIVAIQRDFTAKLNKTKN